MSGLLASPSSFDFHTLAPLVSIGLAEERRPAVLPTGIAPLDACLPGGGLPEGRLVEISGGRASGKLSLALAVAAHLLARGEAAALIDPEATARPDVRRVPALATLLVVRGGGLAAALRATDALLRCGAFPFLAIDLAAVGAPLPRSGAIVRLAREARIAGTVLALLTEPKPWRSDGLSALVSLRLAVRRGQGPFGRLLEIAVARNRSGQPGGRALLDLATA